MGTASPFVRLSSLKDVTVFRSCIQTLGVEIPCSETVLLNSASPLTCSVERIRINGKRIGNRFAIQPMEGWDATAGGGVSENVLRRWRRFGESGAKLICGGEAMAVRLDGRANPNQLALLESNQRDFEALVKTVIEAHREAGHGGEAPVIGFQLTHSGRFCRPTQQDRLEPRVAYRHPLLDQRFCVSSDTQVLTDSEVDYLVEDYVRAARVGRNAGADFIDIKHCHGYLLHEFLSAIRRPGKYGGEFENRTRILSNVVAGIRADGNPIDLAVRLSAFDTVPFQAEPASSSTGKPGVGVPASHSHLIPYEYGFGINPDSPLECDLTEVRQFLDLCGRLGIKIINLSAGSPYYNPHIQRPAAYPPSDGYLPPEDPLVGVARQMRVARELKRHGGDRFVFVGSAYSYLQEFLPQVAQAAVEQDWIDIVGIGRMALSYPAIFTDALRTGRLNPRFICRTFSDCTTAPRNGLVSGCYPLDEHYRTSAAAAQLKSVKRLAAAGSKIT